MMSRWGSRAGDDAGHDDFAAGFGGEDDDAGFGGEGYDDQAAFSGDEGDEFGGSSGPLTRRGQQVPCAGPSGPSRRTIEAPPPRPTGAPACRGRGGRGGPPSARTGGRRGPMSESGASASTPGGSRRPSAAGTGRSARGSSSTAVSRRAPRDAPPSTTRNRQGASADVRRLIQHFHGEGAMAAFEIMGPLDPEVIIEMRESFWNRGEMEALNEEQCEAWGIEDLEGLSEPQIYLLFHALIGVAQDLEMDGFDPAFLLRNQNRLGPAFMEGMREADV